MFANYPVFSAIRKSTNHNQDQDQVYSIPMSEILYLKHRRSKSTIKTCKKLWISLILKNKINNAKTRVANVMMRNEYKRLNKLREEKEARKINVNGDNRYRL